MPDLAFNSRSKRKAGYTQVQRQSESFDFKAAHPRAEDEARGRWEAAKTLGGATAEQALGSQPNQCCYSSPEHSLTARV